jgi:Domain of unknown function (DUF4335)
MTIQRQYSLPNCTLFLEGLSDATTGNGQSDLRPILSILVNAECHFAGAIQSISGGREFFESLVKAVSRYAQEFLSGIPHPNEDERGLPLVQLQALERNKHRLVMQNREDGTALSNGATGNSTPTAPIQIDLTTVQLFDLVEAIDQFFADSQTLPDLTQQLTPVSRRYAKTDEPLGKRVVPAAVGVSSLALAAIAFFFIPVPQVQKPTEPELRTNSNSLSPSPVATEQANTGEPPVAPSPTDLQTPIPLASPSPSPTDSPTTEALVSPFPLPTDSPTTTPLASPSPSPTNSPTPEALATPSPSPTDSPTPEALATPSPSPTTPTTLATASEITDPIQLSNLNQQLFDQVNQAWANRAAVSQDLVYRVSVDQDGTVVNYQPINSAAGQAVSQTPLPTLLRPPVAGSSATQKPVADFKVIFTSKGVPEVSLWKGETATPQSAIPQSSTPNVASQVSEITDNNQLRELRRSLYDKIQQSREGKLRFPDKLEFRVAVRPDGTIIDYQPRNQPAFDHVNETPLPKLKSSNTPVASATSSTEPVAYYRVVFTRRGVLEISPWRGFR